MPTLGDFLYWVAVAVVGGIILAGLGFAAQWLRAKDNRERVLQRLCQHDWVRVPESDPEDALIVIRTYEAECSKCGARK